VARVWRAPPRRGYGFHVHIFRGTARPWVVDRGLLKTASGRGIACSGRWTPQPGNGPPAGLFTPDRISERPPANNFPRLMTRLIGRAADCAVVRDLSLPIGW